MKGILRAFALVTMLFTGAEAQVVVYLQGRYLDSLLTLDSILVENTTQDDRMVLPAPPLINTYAIDLLKGIIINGDAEKETPGTGVSLLFSCPGHAGILIDQRRREPVSVDLIDLSGQVVRHWKFETGNGMYRFDLRTGIRGLYIWRIQSPSLTYRLKVVGTCETETSCRVSGTGGGIKSEPMFLFQPGDNIRFTAYKSGMYKNSTDLAPVDGDTAVVALSLPCPGTPTVTDYDGNVYPTVLINGLCWMRENLRTKHYADGWAIPQGTGEGDLGMLYQPRRWFVVNDDPSHEAKFGLLYTGYAAVNCVFDRMTQGVCPNGWHVSTNIEWCEMEQFLDSTVNSDCLVGEGPKEVWIGTNLFPKLAEYGTDRWYFWGLKPYSTNESGFSGVGGGKRQYAGGYLGHPGNGWYWMSRVLGQLSQPYNLPGTRLCSGGYRALSRMTHNAAGGLSVRCVKNY